MQSGAENGSAAFRGRAVLRSCRGSSFKDCPLRRLYCRRCLRLAVHRERCRRVRFARHRDQADILAPALAEPPARIRTVSPGTGAAPCRNGRCAHKLPTARHSITRCRGCLRPLRDAGRTGAWPALFAAARSAPFTDTRADSVFRPLRRPPERPARLLSLPVSALRSSAGCPQRAFFTPKPRPVSDVGSHCRSLSGQAHRLRQPCAPRPMYWQTEKTCL